MEVDDQVYHATSVFATWVGQAKNAPSRPLAQIVSDPYPHQLRKPCSRSVILLVGWRTGMNGRKGLNSRVRRNGIKPRKSVVGHSYTQAVTQSDLK